VVSTRLPFGPMESPRATQADVTAIKAIVDEHREDGSDE
jgi:hypothetical protein